MARPHPDKTGTKTSDDCNRQGKIRRKVCENIWLLDIRVTGLRWEQVVKRLLAGSYQWPKLQEDERAQICRYGAGEFFVHLLLSIFKCIVISNEDDTRSVFEQAAMCILIYGKLLTNMISVDL